MDVAESGVRGKRGDFEALISGELFFRVQAALSGRVPSSTPQQRAHPDFPLRTIVRCESCGRGLTGSWSKGRSDSSSKVPLCKGATGTGFQISLEGDSSLLVGELDADVEVPRTIARSVRTAAGVVVGDAGGNVRGQTDVGTARVTHTAQDIDEALRGHGRIECKPSTVEVRQQSTGETARRGRPAEVVATSDRDDVSRVLR